MNDEYHDDLLDTVRCVSSDDLFDKVFPILRDWLKQHPTCRIKDEMAALRKIDHIYPQDGGTELFYILYQKKC